MDFFSVLAPAVRTKFSFLSSSELRLRTVLSLFNEQRTPAELTREFDCSFSQVSRALAELLARGLVQTKDPEKRKEKEYVLSDSGRTILVELRDFLGGGAK